MDNSNRIIQGVADVFFGKKKAIAFVDLCNRENLSILHLMDVVEDVLTEQYAVYN